MIGVHLNDAWLALAKADETRLIPQAWSSKRPSERVIALKACLQAFDSADKPLLMAVNATEDVTTLGRLLADCETEGLQLAGFHDSAALAAAALGLRGVGVVLELQAQTVVATRIIESDGIHRRAAFIRAAACGWMDLHRACMQRIADVMIRQTRFDPLHDARDEEYLRRHLSQWLQQAAERGETTVKLTALDRALEVTLSAEDFIQAMDPCLRVVRRALLDARTPGSDHYFLIPERFLELPGVRVMLSSLGQSPIHVLPDALVAQAVAQCVIETRGSADVMLNRQVRLQPLATSKIISQEISSRFYRRPSHLLYDTRVWPISGALTMGRSAASAIVLPSGIAGVSRQHCTLLEVSGECLIIDHSRHGTWLNEELVRGRQRVSAGDRIRIGDPGVELSLIAVGDAHDQTSR